MTPLPPDFHAPFPSRHGAGPGPHAISGAGEAQPTMPLGMDTGATAAGGPGAMEGMEGGGGAEGLVSLSDVMAS